MTPRPRMLQRAGAAMLASAFIITALAGCRAATQVPASSGQGGPGLNASGEQRGFSGAELVEAAAATKTALGLGGSVLDQSQLAAQGAPVVPPLLTEPGPASCAPLTAPSTAGGLGAVAAALIVAPSDSRAGHTALALKSLPTPEDAAAQVRALAALAATCGRYEAALEGRRVPVAAVVSDPSADAPAAAMVTSTAQVPDTGGSGTRERRVTRALAAKGTVVVEVVLVDAKTDDAAATVRGYVDMAFARLPL